MKICHLKIEDYMISTNEEKFIKIEHIDFENALVFLHYKNDILIGWSSVLPYISDIYRYVFYSQSSNKLDNTYLAIEISPVIPYEDELYIISKYQR